MQVWRLTLCSREKFIKEVTFRSEMEAISVCRVPGVEQCIAIMVFLR